MKILITGGCANGKSAFAQKLAMQLDGKTGQRFYLASMIPQDEEDDARVQRHRLERKDWGFRTIEQGTRIEAVSEKTGPEATCLLDSLTALLSNEMFSLRDGEFFVDLQAPERVCRDVRALAGKVRHLIVISDSIGSGAEVCGTDKELAHRGMTETDWYRRGLAGIERTLAAEFDVAAECVAGVPVVRKGSLPKNAAGAADLCESSFLIGANARRDACFPAKTDTAVYPEIEHGGGIMELIIGGAAQGKTAYAEKNYGLTEDEIFVCGSSSENNLSARCITHLERYVRACLEEGSEPRTDFREDAILIADDISCGIVPVDAEERAWREKTGRYLTRLAEKAAHVTRIFCGLPEELK